MKFTLAALSGILLGMSRLTGAVQLDLGSDGEFDVSHGVCGRRVDS